MTHVLLKVSVFFALTLACSAAVLVVRDTTITVPDGITNKDGLLCTSVKWTTIVTFYVGNYLAHVATVRTLPGEPLSALIYTSIIAIVFPAFGVTKGLDAIFRCARIRGRASPLQTAAHAGALCMLVRSADWRPVEGESKLEGLIIPTKTAGNIKDDLDQCEGKSEERNAFLRHPAGAVSPFEDNEGSIYGSIPAFCFSNHATRKFNKICLYNAPCFTDGGRYWGHMDLGIFLEAKFREIHGSYHLPHGYEWALVPRHAKISQNCQPATNVTSTVSCSYSATKAAAALFQTIYTVITLYRARGDQIDRYGFAAFGLTVAPYAVMSVVNLLGSLVTPDYPGLYMVHSEIMKEAMDRGGSFDGVVGTLNPTCKPSKGPRQYQAIVLTTVLPDGCTYEVDELTINDGGNQPFKLGSLSFDGHTLIVPNHPNFERTDLCDIDIAWTNSRKRLVPYSRHAYFVFTTVTLIPVVIVGVLSELKVGESTLTQKVCTMAWLGFGTYLGQVLSTFFISSRSGVLATLYHLCLYACYSMPAAGGLIVVGGMLKDFGSCIRIY